MRHGDALADISAVKVWQVARRTSGLSLSDVAKAMQRDEATVGGWFAEGTDRFPPYAQVARLCQVLGNPTPIEWLWARYWRLVDGESEPEKAADGNRVLDLLLRGMKQLGLALEISRDAGADLSGRRGRQVAESILLAVSSLSAAALEAAGTAPSRRFRLLRSGEEPAPTWRARLREWWLCRRERRETAERLGEALLVMGAMGHELQMALHDFPQMATTRWATVHRLLADGRRLGAQG